MPKQKNGYDYGVYMCLYAAAVYNCCFSRVTFTDVCVDSPPLFRFLSKERLFKVSPKDFTNFCIELRTLVDRLIQLKRNPPIMSLHDNDDEEGGTSATTAIKVINQCGTTSSTQEQSILDREDELLNNRRVLFYNMYGPNGI